MHMHQLEIPHVASQVGAFGEPGRDPRGWTVTVAYAALVPSSRLGVKAAVRHHLVADSSRYFVMCDQLRSRRGGWRLQPCFAAPGRRSLVGRHGRTSVAESRTHQCNTSDGPIGHHE